MEITNELQQQKERERIGLARSWASIDLSALSENVTVLKSLLPKGCSFLAVVKANAYGHGDLLISRHLNQIGIRDFAVATLEEGIRLRAGGIQGNILILGYTSPALASELHQFGLTQTVADFSHGKALQDQGYPLSVHIKIDTGMHRLGITPEHFSQIRQLFSMDQLTVTGLFTHLCVADSLKEEDQVFSQGQISQFFSLARALKKAGISLPALHIQSSYGILNYPGLPCDYARVGILMYGCYSDSRREVKQKPLLKPVLSLLSHVASIREIPAGQSVGYGRTYQASELKRIAVLPIGYADGYPRSLSNKGHVLIHGKMAPVIGRICMDQMTVDITQIPQVRPGDLVTLIGSDGSSRILAEETAEQAGTIANELLSCLGSRIHRVGINALP